MNIHAIYDGDLAVELFKEKNQKESSENIHMIFMDFNMGRMHGDEATK